MKNNFLDKFRNSRETITWKSYQFRSGTVLIKKEFKTTYRRSASSNWIFRFSTSVWLMPISSELDLKGSHFERKKFENTVCFSPHSSFSERVQIRLPSIWAALGGTKVLVSEILLLFLFLILIFGFFLNFLKKHFYLLRRFLLKSDVQ